MKEQTDWLDLSQSEMDAIIAGLEIEMKDMKDDTGFYRWRPYRVHAPAKKRFRDSIVYFFLLVMGIGLCLYAIAWVILEGGK